MKTRPGPPTPLNLRSPNSRLLVTVDLDPRGHPTYGILFDGKSVIMPSPLGLRLEHGRLLSGGLRVVGVRRSSADRQYSLIAGKTRSAHDHFNQLGVWLEETQAVDSHRTLQLVFRAYDDGVAFRYRLKALHAREVIVIEDELTGFNFADDHDCWGLNLGTFLSGHEGEFRRVRISQIRESDLFDVPLVCQTERAVCAIAEADLKDYAGVYFRGRGDGVPGVRVRLSPRLNDATVAVRGRPGTRVVSPWRVLMIAERAGDLIGSNLITSLSRPSRIADSDWIRPGKYAWDWWSGGVVSGVEQPGMNDASMMRFIDFATEAGLPYMMIDAGWYVTG